MAEKLRYYVYLYVDPRDGKVFYIGKGKEERCLDHLFKDDARLQFGIPELG
jgi:hypothetical protein